MFRINLDISQRGNMFEEIGLDFTNLISYIYLTIGSGFGLLVIAMIVAYIKKQGWYLKLELYDK